MTIEIIDGKMLLPFFLFVMLNELFVASSILMYTVVMVSVYLQ